MRNKRKEFHSGIVQMKTNGGDLMDQKSYAIRRTEHYVMDIHEPELAWYSIVFY
jgi:hypothetical protein